MIEFIISYRVVYYAFIQGVDLMHPGKGKRKLYIFLSCISILLITLGTCTYLAFGSSVPTHNNSTSPSAFLESIRKTQIKGGKLEITADEINGIISDIFKKPVTKKGITINGAYLDIKGSDIALYIPIKYKSFNLVPSIKGNMENKNDKLIYNITSVKLGKLCLPKSLVMDKLKKYSNEDVLIAKDRIEINKYILPFDVKNIYVKDGKITADIRGINTAESQPSNTTDSNASTKGNQNNISVSQTNPTSSKQQTNTIKDTSSTASSSTTSKSSNAKVLKEISGQLNGVLSSVQTSKEKQIILTIQSVINKVAGNPNYPYQAEVNWVKANYKKLPPSEQARVKSAIISNVDITKVLRLVYIFGV